MWFYTFHIDIQRSGLVGLLKTSPSSVTNVCDCVEFLVGIGYPSSCANINMECAGKTGTTPLEGWSDCFDGDYVFCCMFTSFLVDEDHSV
jgi:hypothetical protein